LEEHTIGGVVQALFESARLEKMKYWTRYRRIRHLRMLTIFLADDIQYSFVEALLAVKVLSWLYMQNASLETSGQTGK
jgi:hypothetical protein